MVIVLNLLGPAEVPKNSSSSSDVVNSTRSIWTPEVRRIRTVLFSFVVSSFIDGESESIGVTNEPQRDTVNKMSVENLEALRIREVGAG